MNQSISVLLLEDDALSGEPLYAYLKQRPEMELVQYASSVPESLTFLDLYHFDVVVADLIMPSYDGFNFLEALQQRICDTRVIVVSAAANQAVIERSFAMGANYFMIKPYAPEIMLRRIFDVLAYETPTLHKNNHTSQPKQVRKMLLDLGIPPHLKGYQFLCDCAEEILENRMALYSITKHVYPVVAQKYGITSSKVEIAIRNAIDVAFVNSRNPAIQALFGSGRSKKKRPTNAEFIAYLTERVSM